MNNHFLILLLTTAVLAVKLCVAIHTTLPEGLLSHYQYQQQQQLQLQQRSSGSGSSSSTSSEESDSDEPDGPTKYILLDSVFTVRRFTSETFRVVVPPNTEELLVSLTKFGSASHNIALELRYNAYPTHLSPDTLVMNETDFSYKINVQRPKAGTWIALVMYDNSTGRTAMHPLYDSNKVTLSMTISAFMFSGTVYDATPICAQPQHFVAQANYSEGELAFSFPVARRASRLSLDVISTSGTQACLRYGALPFSYNTSETYCTDPVNHSDSNVSFVFNREIPEEGTWFLSIIGTDPDTESDVWLSINVNVCPTGYAGEGCTGILAEPSSYITGLYSKFDYLRANSSDDEWAYFIYDNTYSQVYGDTLYLGPFYFYTNDTVYLRKNAPPTKELYDFILVDPEEYKIVNPEHTVWCKY